MIAAVMSFCALCLFLVIGKLLRIGLPILQRLYLPASVIGGIVALVWLNTGAKYFSPSWQQGWNELPGFLINIVFAALFLGSRIPGLRRIWSLAAPQLCYGQLIAWGQYVVGLGLAIVVLIPFFGVHPAFGSLIEIGFEGGHGTVAGLADTFRELGWQDGAALGYTMATAGMILGIVIGMALINFAARRGYVGNIRTYADQSRTERRGIYPHHTRPLAGRQTVFSDSVDSLALHIAAIGLAVLIGFGFKQLLLAVNTVAPDGIRELRVLDSFPLFPLCMIGGLILQKFITLVKADHLIDHGQIQRLGGAALDFLVVSAVASIRLDFVLANWLPLLILILAGTAWNVFGVLYLAPRLLKGDWFERAIAEFGQSMGVTATGLLLLRTADPESRSSAPAAFGYKQLLHEPFMGGGIWTSLAVPLVISFGPAPVWLISVGVMLFWILFHFLVLRRRS